MNKSVKGDSIHVELNVSCYSVICGCTSTIRMPAYSFWRGNHAGSQIDNYPFKSIMISAILFLWDFERKTWGSDLRGYRNWTQECRWCRFLWHGQHKTNVTKSPQQGWGYDLILSRERTWTHESITPCMAAVSLWPCICTRVCFHFQETKLLGQVLNFYDFCHNNEHT